jgi:hypothetical protein
LKWKETCLSLNVKYKKPIGDTNEEMAKEIGQLNRKEPQTRHENISFVYVSMSSLHVQRRAGKIKQEKNRKFYRQIAMP